MLNYDGENFEKFLEELSSKGSGGIFNFDHVSIENSVINFNLPPRLQLLKITISHYYRWFEDRVILRSKFLRKTQRIF